jgi:hypothetical protein
MGEIEVEPQFELNASQSKIAPKKFHFSEKKKKREKSELLKILDSLRVIKPPNWYCDVQTWTFL